MPLDLEDNDELMRWLALNESGNALSLKSIERLYRELGSISVLWQGDNLVTERFDITKENLETFRKKLGKISLSKFSATLEELQKGETKIVRLVDRDYPRSMLNASTNSVTSPPVIFVKGNFSSLDRRVAIVGTRNPSVGGRLAALKIAGTLSKKNYIIVSGLARGIDEWAHVGALQAKNGRSIAVLPWLDPIYPPEHAELAKDILQRGALVSDQFQNRGHTFARRRFVERNRITSAISKCVIAIESDLDGGTVRQVEIAEKQGIKVFALTPGTNERANRGFKVFLDHGAQQISGADEVLEYLKSTEDETKNNDSVTQHRLTE